MWGSGDVKLHSVKSQEGSTVTVAYTFSERELLNLGYVDTDLVFKTGSVHVNGALYAIGSFVALDAKGPKDINVPTFGEINEIIIGKESTVYLRIIIYTTLHLDTDFNAYTIQCENNRDVAFLHNRRSRLLPTILRMVTSQFWWAIHQLASYSSVNMQVKVMIAVQLLETDAYLRKLEQNIFRVINPSDVPVLTLHLWKIWKERSHFFRK